MPGLYEHLLLPRLIDWAMRNDDLLAYRRRLAAIAAGRVLEVGIGSGLNLPLYTPAVDCVIGIDLSAALLRRAGSLATSVNRPNRLVQASAEAIPLKSASIDTIVMTWTLCSIPDASAALREMHRVLKPSGQLLFVEHGLASDQEVAWWQYRLDPLSWRISCHLDNPVDRLLKEAGFRVEALQTGYLPRGPKFMTFIYEGRAMP
jgi:ubiquinone/menaquinone biosynthesis C-methylase UbiE